LRAANPRLDRSPAGGNALAYGAAALIVGLAAWWRRKKPALITGAFAIALLDR
jgi:hypothetical protein